MSVKKAATFDRLALYFGLLFQASISSSHPRVKFCISKAINQSSAALITAVNCSIISWLNSAMLLFPGPDRPRVRRIDLVDPEGAAVNCDGAVEIRADEESSREGWLG